GELRAKLAGSDALVSELVRGKGELKGLPLVAEVEQHVDHPVARSDTLSSKVRRGPLDELLCRLLRALEPGFVERAEKALHVAFHHVGDGHPKGRKRSEEHTSELQSRENLVC